jgi:hypothetical protein
MLRCKLAAKTSARSCSSVFIGRGEGEGGLLVTKLQLGNANSEAPASFAQPGEKSSGISLTD